MNTPVLVRREEFGVGRKQLEISNEELGQHRIILSADTVSEVRQLLSQKRR